MIGRDRDFNHVEDIGRQYYVLTLVEFQTFANLKHKDRFLPFVPIWTIFQNFFFLHSPTQLEEPARKSIEFLTNQ